MLREQTFYGWLEKELADRAYALVTLYEERDRLLYSDAPALRQKYMDAIGVYENEVLKTELEVSMLRRKCELMQAALNRRESISLEEIEKKVTDEKKEKLQELEAEDKTRNDYPQLGDEDSVEIQKLYHNIVSTFHPAVNTGESDTEKELYEKAVEAYRNQNLESVRMIHKMLFPHHSDEQISVSRPVGIEEKSVKRRSNYSKKALLVETDYALAKKLYPFFVRLEEDCVILNAIDGYSEKMKAVESEIADIRLSFPFNAEATLNSVVKTDAYLSELRSRASRCEKEKEELERQVDKLLHKEL